MALGVPTIWNDLLRAAGGRSDADMSSLRTIVAGGAAVPRFMIEAFRERHGVDVLQGWGMTETEPAGGGVDARPRGVSREHEIDYRVKAGRVMAGVEIRITDEAGDVLARDGVAVGEFELRGPWITGSYYSVETPDLFRDGWLRTATSARWTPTASW